MKKPTFRYSSILSSLLNERTMPFAIIAITVVVLKNLDLVNKLQTVYTLEFLERIRMPVSIIYL
jgi:hypothetical protein